MSVKYGNDALNSVYATIERVLNNSTAGKEILIKSAHIEQELAVEICKETGLICGHANGSGWIDWHDVCTRKPRARGLCMMHYQQRYCKKIVIQSEEGVKRLFVGKEG